MPRSHKRPQAPQSVPSPIVAAATWGRTPDENQDACATLVLDGCALVVVADGISNSPRGDLAARLTVQAVTSGVQAAWEQGQSLTLDTLWRACKEASRRIAAAQRDLGLTDSPATTVIIAAAMPDRLLLAYAGDGGIMLSGGNTRYVGNLLMPHVDEADHLSRYLSATMPVRTDHLALLDLRPSLGDGAVVIVGTDGVFANGQVAAGWYLANDLHDMFLDDPAGFTAGRVQGYLESKLQHPLADDRIGGNIDDDRTLGVLVTGETLAFWWKQALAIAERNPAGPGGNA